MSDDSWDSCSDSDDPFPERYDYDDSDDEDDEEYSSSDSGGIGGGMDMKAFNPNFYYCQSCKTYHRRNKSNQFIGKTPDFNPQDLLFPDHPVFTSVDDPKRPTRGYLLNEFSKKAINAFVTKQQEKRKQSSGTSSSEKIGSSGVLPLPTVDPELLEKATQNLEKFEKKEKQGDELVNEIVTINLGESSEGDLSLIELNVNGKIYKTIRKTIMRYESMIRVMIENKESGGFDIETDSEGRIVFKAVPHADYFKYILMYFRGEDESERSELEDDITECMKRKFKFITEDFNMANFLEFHEICNFFCVKDLLLLIEKKINNFGNVIELHSLSEKYRRIEEEKEEYQQKISNNEAAVLDVRKQIEEVLKQLTKLDEQQKKLMIDGKRLQKEQSLILKLMELKNSFKKEDLKTTPVTSVDITFSIGGEDFSFMYDELAKFSSSLLYRLMVKQQDKTKPIFLDRDPSLFSYIYKFIKNGTPPTSLQNQKQIKLIDESKFYGVDQFTDLIDLFRYPVEELSEEDRAMRETEGILRKLFSYDRENPLIEDPYIFLISVFDNLPDFYPVYQPTTERLLFDYENNMNTRSCLFPIVASSKEEFDYNFKVTSKNMFEGLDWNGVFIAGGMIQKCCRAHGSLYSKTYVDNVLNSGGNDIDIFLYGLSKSEAEEKIRHFYTIIKEHLTKIDYHSKDIIIVRTNYTVTFCVPGFPSIQIVTRLYKSCSEILIGFDIDSCCVGYDGNNVWCLPRFRRAISRRYNLVDVERQSLTYEIRLRKYAYRGYRVMVPGYKPHLVKKGILGGAIHSYHSKELTGLAWLLHVDDTIKAPRQDFIFGRRGDVTSDSVSSEDSGSEEDPNKHSDYGDYFSHNIMSYPFDYMYQSYQTFIKTHRASFICTVNNVEHIINSKEVITANHDITESIGWITEQPGRQLLGSLHPVFSNFYACAYDATWKKPKQ